MFTFTDSKDIEWAYEQFETVEEALEEGIKCFGHDVLLGEIGKDNKVTPLTDIKLSYANAIEWGEIHHPELGWVMTYYPKGVPAYYSYTEPFVNDEGDICCYKYDHDEGCWIPEIIVLTEYKYDGQKVIYL